jgi:hypothetical protein
MARSLVRILRRRDDLAGSRGAKKWRRQPMENGRKRRKK